MVAKMNILLVNDDGFDALGIQVLLEASNTFNSIVIAPSVEQSAKGHSFTMSSPLYLTEVFNNQYHLSGTPADCTYFGLNFLCPNVDIVLSGINLGANLGTDIYYSGTVAAAREGFLKGKMSFAFSMMEDVEYSSADQKVQVYTRAAKLALELVQQICDLSESAELWNINFPASAMLKEEAPKVCIKKLGHRKYQARVHERKDPRGRTYFWIGGPPEQQEPSDTDEFWCGQGYVVMTPLQLDCTSSRRMEELKDWTPILSMR